MKRSPATCLTSPSIFNYCYLFLIYFNLTNYILSKFIIISDLYHRAEVRSVVKTRPTLVDKTGILKALRYYSSTSNNSKDTNPQSKERFIPAAIYPNAYLNKSRILEDNKNKTGIYR